MRIKPAPTKPINLRLRLDLLKQLNNDRLRLNLSWPKYVEYLYGKSRS